MIAAVLAGGLGVLASVETKIPFNAALLVGAAALFAFQPYFALLGLLLVLASEPGSTFLALMTLGGGALALVVTRRRLPAKRVTLPFLGLLLIALPSVPLGPSPDEGFKPEWLQLPKTSIDYLPAFSYELSAWVHLGSIFVVFCIAVLAVTSARRLRALVAMVLLSAVGPVVIGLHQLATGQTSGARADGIQGPFAHPNDFAFYLLVVLTLGIVALAEARARRTLVPVSALMVAASVCFFATYTRAAWIGIVAVVALMAAIRYRRLWVLSALVLVLALTALPSTATKVEDRFGDLTGSASIERNSWEWRTGQWERMLPHGFERPFTGQGFGSYTRITVREFGTMDPNFSTNPLGSIEGHRGFAAHNDFVKMFVEMGFPGLLLWTWILLALTWQMFVCRMSRATGPYATAGFAVMVALIGISASADVQNASVVGIYAFALCGGVIGARRPAQPPQERARIGPSSPSPATEPGPPADEEFEAAERLPEVAVAAELSSRQAKSHSLRGLRRSVGDLRRRR